MIHKNPQSYNFFKDQYQVLKAKLEQSEAVLETIKKRHNILLVEAIFRNLEKNEIKKIYDQMESRLSDEGDFYMRLDKQSLLDKSFILTEDGDCFHIKIKTAGYPAKRQIFIKTIKRILDKYKE